MICYILYYICMYIESMFYVKSCFLVLFNKKFIFVNKKKYLGVFLVL